MNKHTHTQYTSVLRGNPNQEKTTECFFLCIEELNSLEAPTSFVFQLQLEGGSNPLISQDTTLEKLQLPNSLAITKRRLQPPMFFGYNRKVATITYPCLVLPPSSRSRMMEPLSHYHCEIYHWPRTNLYNCPVINLYMNWTCINKIQHVRDL